MDPSADRESAAGFREKVMVRIESLPRTEQLILSLWVEHELSWAEIGAVLDLPPDVVRAKAVAAHEYVMSPP